MDQTSGSFVTRKEFFFLLFCCAAVRSAAFVHSTVGSRHHHQSQTSVGSFEHRIIGARSNLLELCYQSSSDDNDVNADEMEELVISLSLEPTDEARRERLSSLFAIELAKTSGSPEKFSELFGSTLNKVGDRVQLMAAKKASKEKSDEPAASRVENTAEGRQLWALIDMMVQSKTLFKRYTDSKGSFQ